MDLKEQVALMGHAQEFVKSAADQLKTRLGRPATEEEMFGFYSAVACMNLSFCYAKMHESGGFEPAGIWLEQVFKQIGVAVQSRGIPVTLEMNLKSTPMEEEAEQGTIDQGRPPIVICKCVTDAQGQCQSCFKELHKCIHFCVFIRLVYFESRPIFIKVRPAGYKLLQSICTRLSCRIGFTICNSHSMKFFQKS